MRLRKGWSLYLLAGMLACPQFLAAQAVSGTILGAVRDQSGATIIGATVTLTNTDTGLNRTVATNTTGEYVAPSLPTGNYTVTAELRGFKRISQSGIPLGVDQKLRIDLVLQVGEVTESIEVVGNAPLVQSDSSEMGGTIGENQVRELPLNGRDFVALTRLLPGVLRGIPGQNIDGSGSVSWRMSASFSANGQRTRENNFMLDGVDNNEYFLKSAVVFPNVDAIEEFKVQTSTYAPEFGRAGGGVVNIQIKSGTNSYHGSLFEFFRNDKLDANDWFNNKFGRARPPFRQNQFGGTLGGRLIRDKTFFFMDYQGWRRREGQAYLSNVPTAAMKAGDFSDLNRVIYDPTSQTAFLNNRIPVNRFDGAAKNILDQLYPDANVPGTRAANGQLINNYLNNPVLKRMDDQFDVKGDHQFSSSNHFSLRYSFERTERALPATLPHGDSGFTFGAGAGLVRAQSASLNDTHTFNANWLNEFRAGFSRFASRVTPIDWDTGLAQKVGIAGINISSFSNHMSRIDFQPGDIRNLGPSGNQPLFIFMPTLQLLDNVTYARSRHTMKFGFSYTYRRMNILNTDNPVGQFIFQPALTSNCAGVASGCTLNANAGFSVASFLLGLPSSESRQMISGMTGEDRPEIGAYFQDDYRVSSRLTLNLGIRYDLLVPMVEDYDRQSNFDVGNGKFVVASPDATFSGGRKLGRKLQETHYKDFGPRFGFAYNVFGDGRTILRGGYGIFWNDSLTGTPAMKMTNPPFLLSQNFTTTLLPTLRLSSGLPAPPVPDPSREPEGTTRSIYDLDYGDGYVQQWNFNVQKQLGRDYMLEVGYVAGKGTHLAMKGDINQAPPVVGVTNVDLNRPYINISPKLRQLSQAQSRGFTMYHSLQAKFTKRFSRSLMFLNSYTWGKVLDVTSDVEDLPLNSYNFGQDKSVATYNIAHTWTSSWSWELPFGTGKKFASGAQPVVNKLLGGWEVSGILLLRTGLPFTVVQQQNLLSTGTANRPDRVRRGSLDNPTPDRWFDLTAFRPTTDNTGTYGNSGRNILWGPGQQQVDLSLVKNTRLTERVNHQFKFELFNALNHAQFAQPGNSIGTGSAGVISSLLFTTPMRQIQFVMKLSF